MKQLRQKSFKLVKWWHLQYSNFDQRIVRYDNWFLKKTYNDKHQNVLFSKQILKKKTKFFVFNRVYSVFQVEWRSKIKKLNKKRKKKQNLIKTEKKKLVLNKVRLNFFKRKYKILQGKGFIPLSARCRISIKFTRRNIFFTLFSYLEGVIFCWSTGFMGFEFNFETRNKILEGFMYGMIFRLYDMGFVGLDIVFKGIIPFWVKENFINVLIKSDVIVCNVIDNNLIAHNGCRFKKRQRK